MRFRQRRGLSLIESAMLARVDTREYLRAAATAAIEGHPTVLPHQLGPAPCANGQPTCAPISDNACPTGRTCFFGCCEAEFVAH